MIKIYCCLNRTFSNDKHERRKGVGCKFSFVTLRKWKWLDKVYQPWRKYHVTCESFVQSWNHACACSEERKQDFVVDFTTAYNNNDETMNW